MSLPSLIDVDVTFGRGMKSDCDPATLSPGYYWNSFNLVNRGAVLQTRPGYRCKVTLPDGNLQGAALFRPKQGLEQVVVVVDGIVYVSEWPFAEFRELPNVLFSPYAKQIYFCLAEQSVQRIDDTDTSAIEFITSKNVLIMQDGALTAPAWYDGSQSGHDRGSELGIPIGGVMAWVGNRLWVANGSSVFASDIGNPFSFRERLYPGNLLSNIFPGPVTGMAATPSLEFPQLLVFTETTGNLVRADIQTRSDWQTTPGFQREVFKVGSVGQRSIVAQYGLLWWFSPSGWTNLDVAAASKQSARLPSRDMEMTVSKAQVSGDLSLIAGSVFANYLLLSVPHADAFNSHTWVMDNAPVQELNAATAPAWCGTWTGTRPVEWVYGVIAGQERAFYVSVDYDGKNRLWEAFTEERADNGCPISWALETRGFFGPTAQVQYAPLRDKKFAFADINLGELLGDVDIGVWWAGACRGAYKRCSVKRIRAAEGNLRWDKLITEASILFALKSQSRRIRTEDARQQNESEQTSCAVESEQTENIDNAFQLLICGSGQAAINSIRVFAQEHSENPNGKCEADETEENAVRFDGAASEGSTFDEAVALLAAGSEVFESAKSVSLSHGEFDAVGSGYATSIISQEAADKIATIAATKQAEALLQKAMPSLISDGEHYDENGI